MADIREIILNKYNIDIDKEKILKLYGIDKKDISDEELTSKIEATVKKWNISVNGANEKNAIRDSERLKNAAKYEAILRDKSIRKNLFDYYSGSKSAENQDINRSVDFAREYFSLVATTKKIRNSDIEFFFDYYKEERKNQKAIMDMLSKELKIHGNAVGEKEDNNEDDSNEVKKKSNVIVNLFEKKTIIKIKTAIDSYNEAKKSEELCKRYNGLGNSLYDYLEINDVSDAESFSKLMHKRGQEIYVDRLDRGAEYNSLVDLFNIFEQLGGYQDVSDNIPEFKLLIKYPNLTPFMFAFVNMKKETLEGIVDIAYREYKFQGDKDFIQNYYEIMYDNFGISNSGINSILKKAQKKANTNKIVDKVDKKVGYNTNNAKLPFGVKLIHGLIYWPLFVMYFIFYVFKTFFKSIKLYAIPAAIAAFVVSNNIFPKFLGFHDDYRIFAKLLSKKQWLDVVYDMVDADHLGNVRIVLLSIAVLGLAFVFYIGPAIAAFIMVFFFADDFNKHFDWIGYDRTFKGLFAKIKNNTRDEYFSGRKNFVKRKIPQILLNVLGVIVIAAIIIIISVNFA